MGSTKTLADAFNNRKFKNTTPIFYSLECNKEKCEDAAKLYTGNQNIHILNEVLWNKLPSNFYELYPQCLHDEVIKAQFAVDLENMKNCNLFLERPELPESFDFVLLDGGDYTTYFDFQVIKDRCRFIFINDVNNDKGALILKEMSNSRNWRTLVDGFNDGYIVAENITHHFEEPAYVAKQLKERARVQEEARARALENDAIAAAAEDARAKKAAAAAEETDRLQAENNAATAIMAKNIAAEIAAAAAKTQAQAANASTPPPQ
jgi:hypothetical protein